MTLRSITPAIAWLLLAAVRRMPRAQGRSTVPVIVGTALRASPPLVQGAARAKNGSPVHQAKRLESKVARTIAMEKVKGVAWMGWAVTWIRD